MEKKTLTPDQLTCRSLPYNYRAGDLKVFANELEKIIPENYVLNLKNVYIVEETLIYNSRILGSYTHTFRFDLAYKIKVFAKKFILQKIKVEYAIWITDDLSGGYFHWVLDCLPRLLNIAKIQEKKSSVVILTPEIANQKFVQDSLKMLGYQYFVKEDKKINIKCKNLLVGNHCARTTGNYNESLIRELRALFLDKITVNESEKKKWIYISREKATRRKAKNEVELVNMLQGLGVEIHYFEEYSFLKQMEILAHTDYLIAIHGASLTNMLFMADGTNVIELRNSADTHNNCYFSLASALNINYHYLLNKGDDDNIPHFADLKIDIENLKNYILSLK